MPGGMAPIPAIQAISFLLHNHLADFAGRPCFLLGSDIPLSVSLRREYVQRGMYAVLQSGEGARRWHGARDKWTFDRG
ncbi:hypothetical protein ABB26_14020 [Stenotrophomonas humi]|uniref:Uncharacterized protein n=1 Tax=Stenotrophomonas humi TaxID=405444 RepID=A0A0R0C0N8_9GAMM|nr:hypothetical protein ABB26_14020 [Stenotrophomonas humi]